MGVTISFEAVPGGGMEEVEAVGNLRAATAVFRVDKGHWATDGRAIFNLNPAEAVRYYQDNLELVCDESPHVAGGDRLSLPRQSARGPLPRRHRPGR